jgi:hypothetical protein
MATIPMQEDYTEIRDGDIHIQEGYDEYTHTRGLVYRFLVPREEGKALGYWRLPVYPYTRVLS